MRLVGRVALVTGAGRGIGAETARGLAGAGADVALADLDLPAAEEMAGTLRKTGRRAVALRVDVTEPASVRDMVARVLNVPVGRWRQPEEVAAAVVFLCSEEASYICGAVVDVNGGSFVG